MKTILLIILSFFSLTGTIIAQPVIQSSDIANVIGETQTVHICQWESAGSAGVDQTWDFSSLVSQTSATIEILDPASTPAASSFTNATVAQHIPIQGTHMYFDYSPTAHTNFGLVGGGATIAYSDPEIVFPFPLSFGNTNTDSFAASFVSQSFTWDRSGSTTSNVDGYGTLITPAGTFTDVLRVKIQQDYQDELQSFPQIQFYESEVYHWYKAGIHYPLMVNTTLTINSQSQSNVQYTDISTGIQETDKVQVLVFPNPTTDLLTVGGNEFSSSSFQILDPIGRIVLEGSTNNNRIDVSALSRGTYVLMLNSNSGKIGKQTFNISK